MARRPINGLLPQYAKNAGGASASGYYLKLFAPNTTSAKTMYTLQSGGVALSKCKLNSRGETINNVADDDSTFIPYVDGDCDAYLFFTEADADANNTANSIFLGQSIVGELVDLNDLPDYISAEFSTVATMSAGTSLNLGAIDFADYVGRKVRTVWNNTTSKKGGAEYVIWTLADYRTFIGDGAWVPDGDVGTFVGGDHYVGGGTTYVAILDSEPSMGNFGATFSGDQSVVMQSLGDLAGHIKSDTSFSIHSQVTFDNPIVIDGDYHITCEGNVDCVIRCNNALTWSGVKPVVGSGVTVNYSFVYSTSILPKFYDFEIGDMRGVKFFESSGSFGSPDVATLTGDFIARGVTHEEGTNSNHLFKLVGGQDWSKLDGTAPTAKFVDCKLRGDSYYYTAKGFKLVEVVDSEFEHGLYRDNIHNWYSQDTGLLNWAENNPANVTIDGGRVTTSAGSNGIISDSGDTLTAGEVYRLSISIDFDSGTTFRVYETNSSGALLASGLGSGVHNIEFTAATNCRIYIRFDSASVANFEMVQALKDPTTNAKGSATFDTLTYRASGNIYRGGERGPTSGIDTLNIEFVGNKIFDAWNRAIALDTERFSPPSWDSAYPKSRALVSDNQAYNSGRFIYSTCRHALITDNFADNCAISGAFTGTPSAVRFNSDDWGFNDFSHIYIHDNIFTGCGSNPVISCDADHRIVQYDNLHDSANSYPIRSLKGVYRYPPSALSPKTGSFTLDPSMPFVYVQYATTGTFLEISVPNDDNLVALGYEYTIVFVGTVGDVRLKAQSGDGTINGGTLAVVPVSTKICKVVNTNSACDHLGVFLN